jgi:hypothetical protein
MTTAQAAHPAARGRPAVQIEPAPPATGCALCPEQAQVVDPVSRAPLCGPCFQAEGRPIFAVRPVLPGRGPPYLRSLSPIARS